MTHTEATLEPPTEVGTGAPDLVVRPTRLDRLPHRTAMAAGIWFLTALNVVVGVALWARSGFRTPPYVFMHGPAPMIGFLVAVVAQSGSGLVVAVRRPGNPIGWIVLAFSFVVSGAVLALGFLAWVESSGTASGLAVWVAWLPSTAAFSVASLLAISLGVLFPDGRVAGPRWRWVFVVAAVGAMLCSVSLALIPGPLLLFPSYRSPVTVGGIPRDLLSAGLLSGIALLTAGAIGTGLALTDRYRLAVSVERLQIRWYVASGLVLVLGFLAFLAAVVILDPSSALGELILTLFMLGLAVPPVAILFAILRYRLYDIDTILNRAFVYGALTAILAGVYTASIRLFNYVFTAVTGEKSDLALVVTTLILATSFTPIKRRLEEFVDRRFPSGDRKAEGPGSTSSAGPAAIFSDPAFVASFDQRVRAILRERGPRDDARP